METLLQRHLRELLEVRHAEASTFAVDIEARIRQAEAPLAPAPPSQQAPRKRSRAAVPTIAAAAAHAMEGSLT